MHCCTALHLHPLSDFDALYLLLPLKWVRNMLFLLCLSLSLSAFSFFLIHQKQPLCCLQSCSSLFLHSFFSLSVSFVSHISSSFTSTCTCISTLTYQCHAFYHVLLNPITHPHTVAIFGNTNQHHFYLSSCAKYSFINFFSFNFLTCSLHIYITIIHTYVSQSYTYTITSMYLYTISFLR